MGRFSLNIVVFLLPLLLLLLPACAQAQNKSCQGATSCDDCVALGGVLGEGCSWCKAAGTCADATPGQAPNTCGDRCQAADCFYKTCAANSQTALYIIVPCVILGVLIVVGVLVYCCWWLPRKRNRAWQYKEDDKAKRRKAERAALQDERRDERRAQTDNIRTKYGLSASATEA